jgi:hypothetical protein
MSSPSYTIDPRPMVSETIRSDVIGERQEPYGAVFFAMFG